VSLFAFSLLLAFVPTNAIPTASNASGSTLAQAEVAPADDPPLAVEIKLSKTTFAPLEPIVAAIKITNTSNDIVYLDSYYDYYKVMDFEVVDTEPTVPKSVPRTYYHQQQVVSPGQRVYDVKVKPGDSYGTSLVVNLVSDMTSTSHYSVVLVVPYWKSHGREKNERKIFRSEALKVEVKGRVLTQK
jgi:hypothetical protein